MSKMLDEVFEECGFAFGVKSPGTTEPQANASDMRSISPDSLLNFLMTRTRAEEEEDSEEGVSDVGFNTDIEEETIKNENFRKVLYTTDKSQLVLMSLKPGEEIGSEVHNGDQFFRFEAGEGKLVMGEEEIDVTDGTAAVVREGTQHNVINTSRTKELKLYAVYSPPQHKPGTVDQTKPEHHEEVSEATFGKQWEQSLKTDLKDEMKEILQLARKKHLNKAVDWLTDNWKDKTK